MQTIALIILFFDGFASFDVAGSEYTITKEFHSLYTAIAMRKF